jgi:hypothetical protein
MVEDHHFTPEVENLVKPMFMYFGSDIAYTLHGFPNHVRALASMERLAEREKTDKPKGAHYTVECYYRRALRFVPDDHLVRLMYAQYLKKHQRPTEAIKVIEYVDDTVGDEPGVRQIVGLLFIDLGLNERAYAQFSKVSNSDVVMPALRTRLISIGFSFTDIPPQAAASSPSADPGAASSNAK